MIDPIYTTTLIVGGSTHKYAFTALPTELLAEQSLDLSVTITKADGSPFDLSSATAEFFCTARNVSGLVPTNLGSATLSDSGSGTTDTVSIVVPKNGIPDFLGDYSPTRTGSSVFYFQIQDADSYIQIYQYVNVIDSNFNGDGSGSIELPSSSLLYTPADGADWPDPDPTTVEEGLDDLADRVKTIEDNPASGDMLASVYDVQNIQSDAFDRNNMTGTQLASTISDFDSAVSANANVSGSVTVHSDVSDAGSGAIISTTERSNLSTAFAHVSSTANPHNVTPAQLGNTTAQWNASQAQGIDLPIPAGASDDQKVLTYDDASGDYLLSTPPGAGGGETNDLALDAGATGESIRVTKSGSDIIIKGIASANTNIAVATSGSDIELTLVDSAENIRGAIAIANTATVDAGLDDTQAITSSKLKARLDNYLSKTGTSKSTSGAYTLLAGDEGTNVFIDNTLTIPVLTADYQVTVRNTSASAVGITLSGTTAENTSDTQIAGKGTITLYYETTTKVWIDGNTEA